MKKTMIFTFAALGACTGALADDLSVGVAPAGTNNLNNVVVPDALPDPRVKNTDLRVTLTASCFGTNNRSVMNPLSPSSQIEMTLKLKDQPAYKVTFPAKIVTLSADQSLSTSSVVLDASLPSGSQAASSGNHIQLLIPGAGGTLTKTVDSTGQIKLDERPGVVESVSFNQVGVGSGGYYAFYGVTGPLSSSTRWSIAPQGGLLTVSAAFPGQDGFCGGYHSPLMLFFDSKLPAFTGESSFPLNPEASRISWPEAGAPGYFLALPEGSKITGPEHLFGRDDKFKNGFEKLRQHDRNKDGKIDAKDPVFAKLVLWQDKNGDGVAQPEEIRSLKSAGVVSISLKYSDKGSLEFGDRATARETAEFEFTDSGKKAKGVVHDLWFNTRAWKESARK